MPGRAWHLSALLNTPSAATCAGASPGGEGGRRVDIQFHGCTEGRWRRVHHSGPNGPALSVGGHPARPARRRPGAAIITCLATPGPHCMPRHVALHATCHTWLLAALQDTRDLVFNATGSRDPDDPSNRSPFSFSWTCTVQEGKVKGVSAVLCQGWAQLNGVCLMMRPVCLAAG